MLTKLLQKRAGVTLIVIVACLIMFELVSYSSSQVSLMGILGIPSWAFLLALAFCLVDFAGLARLVLPDAADFPEMPKYFLWAAWLLSAVGDTWLTYYAILGATSGLTNHILVLNGILTPEFFKSTLPIGASVILWLVQVTLVAGLNVTADRLSRQTRLSHHRPEQPIGETRRERHERMRQENRNI